MKKPQVGDRVKFIKKWPPVEGIHECYQINEEVLLINLSSWQSKADAFVPFKKTYPIDGWSATYLLKNGYCKLINKRAHKLPLP